MDLLAILGAVLIPAVVYWLVSCKDVTPVSGVYRLPGRWYWLKRFVFYILFKLRSLKMKKSRTLTDLNISYLEDPKCESNRKGYGKGDSYEFMEKPQELSNDAFAIDCCYFGASDKNGNNIVCRLARRKEGLAEIWLFLELAGIGCFQHPAHPDTHVYYVDGSVYKAGGLTFEALEPMRRWRVSYSGKLRKGLCTKLCDKPQDFLDVNFSFIWSAFSQPFSFDTDMSHSVIGDGLARELWSKSFFGRLESNHQTHYEQWGELRGRLSLEGFEDRTLHLQCLRDHSYGRRKWDEFHRYIVHFIHLETGLSIHVGVVSQPNLMSHLKTGYVSYPNGDTVSITDTSLRLWEVGESPSTPPKAYSFSVVADGITYQVEVEGGTTPVFYHHENRSGKVMEMFSKFKVNSKRGRGISEFFYRNEDGPDFTRPPIFSTMVHPPKNVIEASQHRLVLAFTDVSCQSPLLVGGKGAQLAQLISLQQEMEFSITQGFCLTLSSFSLQLQKNPSIEYYIQKVTNHCIYSQDSLLAACEECVNLILATDICQEVEEAIFDSLNQLKGPSHTQCHWAVRSSAAGEDGDEASSAGQMETLLGVVGDKQILEAVKKCWSSAYTQQAVEYRRQHGQPIKSLVGVVIQEMVPAQAAGVMFTADPVSGSASHIVINSNFGLGESVVSGKSDPDTIVVERDPDSISFGQMGSLKIGSISLGKKDSCIVEDGVGGIKEECVAANLSSSLSISENLIYKLARLGIELEKRFGSARDIEWAVVKDNIYLLQCRPITVAASEIEEDLLHELDSPLSCDYQWNTTSNISEMMPGAVTPLTMSTFQRSIEYAMQYLNHSAGGRRTPTHLSKSLPSFCNHLFISLIDISSMFVTAFLVRKDVMEISLVGNLLPELSLEQAHDYYGRQEGLCCRLVNFIRFIKVGHKAKVKSLEWEKRITSYTVGETAETASNLYACINSSLADYKDVWLWTLINSSRSGSWSSIIMSVLCANASEWDNSIYGDMALLLSKCQDVYSAEVPHAIEKIAGELCAIQPPIIDKFLDTPDKECMRILNGHKSISCLVEEFLRRHGHRCLRESELREKSWRSAPEKFISVLKMVVKTRSFERKTTESPVTIPELLDQLKSKPSAFKRFVLRVLLPKAWLAVGAREWGKSLSVQMSEVFKMAYNRLSLLMHKEGRIPDPDLMYFLTHQEIGALLTKSSSKLIIRAQKRRKVLSKQQQLKFDKLTMGRPVPVSTLDLKEKSCVGSNSLKGMPVSQGCVVGPARVVHSLDQASVIQAGDILVVTSTDIGWSPFFPIIAGLVTELGGLISHGAVVAREYGIPCVVNVPNATSLLVSGELLEIDGRQGIVRRLGEGLH